MLVVILILFLTACENDASSEANSEIKDLQSQLQKMELQNKQLMAENDPKAFPLVHTVYLNLKENLGQKDKEVLWEAIRALENIPFLHDLELGVFEDLNDKRSLSDLEWVFQMKFKDTADYQKYQEHPTHLLLKKIAKGKLDAPPVTHDFKLK